MVVIAGTLGVQRASTMSTFVLIPGAGGIAWYWHRVVPLLEAAHHEVIAVDLPGDDERKGIRAYADIVVEAIGGRSGVVLVAQSLGGFTAALVAARVPVERIVFVNAMIPAPGETAGAYWDNTRSREAREEAARRHGYSVEFDLATYFLHDVPEEVVKAGADHQRPEVGLTMAEPAMFRWPDVPIDVVIGRDDRFFPRDFQARVARERLGPEVHIVEIPGGHLVALSHPRELADQLLGDG
jgi:pimeloyl-ACP methyl ester carboxylesterase